MLRRRTAAACLRDRKLLRADVHSYVRSNGARYTRRHPRDAPDRRSDIMMSISRYLTHPHPSPTRFRCFTPSDESATPDAHIFVPRVGRLRGPRPAFSGAQTPRRRPADPATATAGRVSPQRIQPSCVYIFVIVNIIFVHFHEKGKYIPCSSIVHCCEWVFNFAAVAGCIGLIVAI